MKLIALTEFCTGKIYHVEPRQIDEFYENSRLRLISKRFAFHEEISRIESDQSLILRIKNSKTPLDPFHILGTLLLKLFDARGELFHAAMHTNIVVDTGKAAVIDRLQAASPAVHDYMAIGTGNTAAAAGDTALQTETGTRVQGALTQPTATTDRLISTFAAGNGTAAITETGRLNASSSGNLFCRSVFAAVNKGASDSLQITYDITVS